MCNWQRGLIGRGGLWSGLELEQLKRAYPTDSDQENFV